MVSKAFFTGSKYLVEDNDGRNDYLRYDDERFLAVLSTAGRKLLQAPFEADDRKAAYLKSLVRLNEAYFSAREYENDAKGRYYKHDDRSERRFRIRTAERFSDLRDDLRTLLAAHDALVEAAADYVDRTYDGAERRRARSAVRSTLLACTDPAVSEAWYPTFEAYYYSLSPGELVAEDRERRKQRIEGTENSRGIAELLDKPGFRKLTERDLRRIRQINRESPGSDARVWKRLLEDYGWYLTHERERERAAPGDEAG
ncbi:hypothetical protein NGM10_01365 [Halorussus salilacus]|uniref:hypothetical protein n=1 Tax=Halorussus salilacus TaxID=2953750 RepID=UPI0020A19249|nr:hypothetical protein [Halorussus salilacus]USZ68403.1 hypothetical protein NGM10_01365 [Halorussus salilacus]